MRVALLTTTITLLALLAPAGPAVLAGPPDTAAEPPKPKAIYDEQADARAEIQAALVRATKENRRVLIQWGANWCGWCHLLHGTFASDPQVRRKLQYEYDVVLVDIGGWDRNLDLAQAYGADLKTSGVPYLTVLDAEGQVLANQETGSLEKKIDGKNGHDPQKVLEFLAKHQAPYEPAQGRLRQALQQAGEEHKAVFLHFGAPWCGWCHRLEAWLAREEVAEILARDFIDLKIDLDRTIGGKDLMNTLTGGKSTGIPFFVFLSPKNEVLAASWGPDGNNLGCPHAPEEIDAYREILRRVRTSITDEEIARITKWLGPQEEPAKPRTVPAETIRQ